MAQSVQVAKVSHRHHAIIDWLLANPHIKNMNVLCNEMGYSRSWLSIVMNSDAFKLEFEQRRNELSSQLGEDVVRTNLEVALKANKKLGEYLDQDLEDVDPRLVLDASNAVVERFYGAKSQQVRATKETVREVHIENGQLSAARELIRETYEQPKNALPAPTETDS